MTQVKLRLKKIGPHPTEPGKFYAVIEVNDKFEYWLSHPPGDLLDTVFVPPEIMEQT